MTGLVLRPLHNSDEMAAASELMARIWRVEKAQSHVSPEMITALAHAGNYVAGAFRNEELIAACVGFFHPPDAKALHSHITGVHPDAAGTGAGTALKLHQREWCLERGITRVTWTYDPLVARNSYFNIHKLGGEIESYRPDFYGDMRDGVNEGQPSDRVLLVWRLDRPPRDAPEVDEPWPAVLRSVDGRPQLLGEGPAPAEHCRVEIPSDIGAVRRADPGLATAWRAALRSALGGLLEAGWTVAGFDRRGHYLLTRSTE